MLKNRCKTRSHLRHRITIQSPTKTENNSGEIIDTWTTYCSARANVMPRGSQELTIDGKQTVAEVTYRIEIWSTSKTRAITSQMRVLFDGRTLNIGGKFDKGERHEFIVLMCKERPSP